MTDVAGMRAMLVKTQLNRVHRKSGALDQAEPITMIAGFRVSIDVDNSEIFCL